MGESGFLCQLLSSYLSASVLCFVMLGLGTCSHTPPLPGWSGGPPIGLHLQERQRKTPRRRKAGSFHIPLSPPASPQEQSPILAAASDYTLKFFQGSWDRPHERTFLLRDLVPSSSLGRFPELLSSHHSDFFSLPPSPGVTAASSSSVPFHSPNTQLTIL